MQSSVLINSAVRLHGSTAHSDTKQGRQQHGRIHDCLLFYTKGNSWIWNPVYVPYDKDYVDQFYSHVEEDTGRRYALDNLTAAKPGGDTLYEWHGVKLFQGRYWAYSKENMEQFDREGRLYYPMVRERPAARRWAMALG